MDCTAWESMIALDAGGDLPSADAARLSRHLTTCAACRRFEGDMRQSRQAVAMIADAPVDDEVLAAVRAGVRRELENTGGRSTVPRLRLTPRLLAVAAMLAVLLGALLLPRSGGPHPPLPQPRVAETPVAPEPPISPPPIEAETPAKAPTEDVVAVREPAKAAASRPRPPIARSTVTAPPATQTAAPTPPVSPTKLATQTIEPPTSISTGVDPPTSAKPAEEPMVIKLVSEDANLVIYWLVPQPDAATKETKDEMSAV